MNASDAIGAHGTTLQPLVLSGHTRTVYSVGFHPDGTQFVSGSTDGTVRTWNTHQARETRPPLACDDGIVAAMAISNDGRWIATSGESWRILLWDAFTHTQVAKGNHDSGGGKAHAGPVECLAFSADATKLVSGAGDTTVAVWGVPTGEHFAGPFRGHLEGVTCVVFSPDGNRIASADTNDVRIQESDSGTLVLPVIDMSMSRAWALAWAPAPNDHLLYVSYNNRIRGIDVTTGAVCLEWTAHALTITCIALSRDGQFIASSSNYARTVQLWDTATQQECVPALQHGSSVRCVAISPDGSHVITGGEDSTVYVWPIRNDLAGIDEEVSPSTSVCVVRPCFSFC